MSSAKRSASVATPTSANASDILVRPHTQRRHTQTDTLTEAPARASLTIQLRLWDGLAAARRAFAVRVCSSVGACRCGSGLCLCQNDARVLKHELRHVKIRLRECTSTVDELSQLNEEHSKELQQQRVYCKRIEEQWAALEDGLQGLAAALPIKAPAPAAATAASANGSNPISALASSHNNPVLNMLSQRWAALTGRSPGEMAASLPRAPKDPSAGAAAPSKDDDMADDQGTPDEDDGGDDEEGGARKQDRHVKLDAALQSMLDQRAAFTRALLAAIVSNLPTPAAPAQAVPADAADLSAQVAALQAERMSLQARLHAAHNEVILLTSELSEREAQREAELEKNKTLLRKVERMRVDMDNTAAAAARNAAANEGTGQSSASSSSSSGPRGGMDGANSVVLDSVPDTRPLSPTSLAKLTAVPPASAQQNSYSDNDFRRLKEEVLEQRLISNSRLDELTAAKKQLTQMELEVRKARMTALQDEKAVRETRIFMQLLRAHNDLRAECSRLQARADMAESKSKDIEQVLIAYQQDIRQQMEMADRKFEEECARHQSTIAQLQLQNQTLSTANTDLQTALPAHPDYAFYTHLRAEILPHMEQTLRTQTAALEQMREERRLEKELQASAATAAGAAVAASADAAAPSSAVKSELGKVLRAWKVQERKLEAEKHALQQEIASLRSAPSSSAPAAAAAVAEASDLRVKLASAQHELESVRTQLSTLQSSSGDVAALQAELESAQELSTVLGNELNEVSEKADESNAAATRLSASVFESTRLLDKLRAERTASSRTVTMARTEVTVQKARTETLDNTLTVQARALKDAKAHVEALVKEQSKAREVQTALQSCIESTRAAAQTQLQEAAEAKSKYSQLAHEHALCDAIVKEMKDKQIAGEKSGTREFISTGRCRARHSWRQRCSLPLFCSSFFLCCCPVSSSLQQSEESVRVLKSRIQRLQEQSGTSSSKRGGGGSSGDASLIKSLQLLVNCKVCETHQKDRVITKCMHTLCQSCVKQNLEVSTHTTHRACAD